MLPPRACEPPWACLVQGRELAEGTVVGFHEGKARQPRGPRLTAAPSEAYGRERPSNNARPSYGEAMRPILERAQSALPAAHWSRTEPRAKPRGGCSVERLPRAWWALWATVLL